MQRDGQRDVVIQGQRDIGRDAEIQGQRDPA
jgi:hypothetical protein